MRFAIYGLLFASSALCAAEATLPLNWMAEGIPGVQGNRVRQDAVIGNDGSVYSVLRYPVAGAANALYVTQVLADGSSGWTQKLLGSEPGFLFATEIIIDEAQNLYFVGSVDTPSNGSSSLLTAMLNSEGVVQWQAERPTDAGPVTGYGIRTTTAGHVVSVGSVRTASGKESSMFLTSYNQDGSFRWEALVSDAPSDALLNVTVETDSAGNVFVLGGNSGNRPPNYLLAKLDADGKTIWSVRNSGPDFFGHSTSLLIDQNDTTYVIYGVFDSTQYFAVQRYLSDGTALPAWIMDAPFGIQEDPGVVKLVAPGELVMAISSYDDATQALTGVVLAIKDGAEKWRWIDGNADHATPRSIAVRADKSVWVSGTMRAEGSDFRSYLQHISAEGRPVGSAVIDHPSATDERCTEIFPRATSVVCSGFADFGSDQFQHLVASWEVDQLMGAGFE